MDVSLWWEGLTALEKVYWAIAIPSSIIFLIQLVLTFFGGEFDTDSDFDMDVDDAGGFHFFTLKNLVAFFTIFGWTGLACLDSGLNTVLSVVISLAAGLLMMTIMGALLYMLGKATESGTLQIDNAIGAVGEVYMKINGSRGNIGQVQVQVQGTLRTLEALTDGEDDLPQGTVVEIKDIANNNILIVSKSQKN